METLEPRGTALYVESPEEEFAFTSVSPGFPFHSWDNAQTGGRGGDSYSGPWEYGLVWLFIYLCPHLIYKMV